LLLEVVVLLLVVLVTAVRIELTITYARYLGSTQVTCASFSCSSSIFYYVVNSSSFLLDLCEVLQVSKLFFFFSEALLTK